MLLEQYLEAGQYEANVKVRPRSNELVEFAVRLPEGEGGLTLWLPIDAKFPIEDYQRLMEAYERIGPCADAREALSRLKAARLKIAILSNGAPRMLAAAVRSAVTAAASRIPRPSGARWPPTCSGIAAGIGCASGIIPTRAGSRAGSRPGS